jgi:acetolactate synthase-1/2/3 large subunit
MIGIHTAFQDSTPLLLFIGQIARVDVGREAFQELDYKQVYSGVAKKVIAFSDAGRIPEQLGQAWQIATSGRPGPVIVELPEDMLTDQTDVADLVPGELVHSSPSPASIEKLSDWLGKSESPIVLCGGAAWTPWASEYLRQFAENQSIPVATTFRRTDSFDNTHSHYVGELGIAPNPRLLDRVQAADLIIAVGPRLGDMTTSGYSIFDVPDRKNQKSGQKLVHAHVSAEEINTVYRADLGIVSHPEQFLKALSELPRSQIDRSESIRDGNRNYLDYLTEPRNIDASLRMDKVAELLRKRLPADAIVTNGAGNYSIWAQRHYQFRQPGTQLASTNGSMGYGVPSAIAAKLVRPDSTVISFSGDGCFLMNGQELATAVQYRLNVIFLVVNNQSYGTIRAHQQRHYPHRPVATALQNPNFAALAEAYGAFGAVVSETDQFESAFEAALNAERPALIELQTDY